ncbi:outer membrane beta-barrel protein [Pedobacter sp. D749]|uniref:outer membrane beta-barrel protein n=1 Tax=Pedobacter sp. D749 TaxID=2856523 RepID=UPI001C568603|nr:outer membrane beta-barrel protein [Pedobacter sp. D749]QXU42530.1 outer membrane beta-barrel protein [Pedobacter sp. D749]
MRKYLLLPLFLLIFTVFSASAQVKSYIGFFGGLSSPIDNFAKSEYGEIYKENNKAGYAKNGFTFGVDGAWYFYKNLALAGVISYQDQGRLSHKDVENLSAGYTDGFAVDNSTVTSNKRYRNLNVLVGPQYSFLLHPKLILDVRAVAGVIKSFSTPELKVDLEDDPTHTFYQRSSTASTFAYGGGIGLRYSLTNKIGLALRGNYIGADGIKITNDNRNINAGRLVTKQPISEIQTTLGLSYNLK